MFNFIISKEEKIIIIIIIIFMKVIQVYISWFLEQFQTQMEEQESVCRV